MKARLTALIAGFLLVVGCNQETLQKPTPVEIVFSVLGDETRLTNPEGETAIHNWTLLLYQDGKLVDAGASDYGTPIKKTLLEGTYTAFAVVNPPGDFKPESYSTILDLEQEHADLGDNAPGQLMMIGSRIVSVPSNETQLINVNRLVCKVRIRKISVHFDNPALANKSFILKGLFLTNCYGWSRLGSDWDASELRSDVSLWYNRMAFNSNEDVNNLLSEMDINASVTIDNPHTQEHHFYFFPNPLPENLDTHNKTWTRRRTRLVLETVMGNRTWYYSVTLPSSIRNRTYVIEEAIIREPGSLDPEQDMPGAIDFIFSTATEDWSPAFSVNENT